MELINSSLKHKFLAVLGSVALFIAVSVSFGYLGVSDSVHTFRSVVDHEIAHERAINGMVSGFKKQVQEWKNVLLRGADDKQRDKYWGKFQKQESAIQATGQSLLTGMPDGEARGLLEQFLASHRDMGVAYRKGYQAFVDAGYDSGAGDKAVKGIDRAPTKLLEDAAELIAADTAQATTAALDRAETASLWALVVTVVVLLAGAVLTQLFVVRSVLRPVGHVATALDGLAGGDFTVDVAWEGRDEIGRLASSTRRIRDDLGQVLQDMVNSARELDDASARLAELGSGNRQQLSRQRDGTSQVATASEELAATAQEVASGAAGAAEAATTAEGATSAGRQVAGEAIDSINRLEADVSQVGQVLTELEGHSAAIGNVLDVIRGIAEQTNLLALNAAIEAARAGDQGRGFAVVADEVRSLAQRTQQSTQEIQATIEQLQNGSKAAVQAMEQGQARVADGVASARQVQQALEDIGQAVSTIVAMNTQIATAAEEQGVVAGDVSRNVNGIDQSSEQLVSSADVLAEAGARIAGLSAGLVSAAGRFRI